jgi:pSer/pThr/pTyr-binding forkhead associated (FHA) protein
MTTTPGTAAAATSPAPSQQRPCPGCGGQTPASFSFCQHCGTKVDAASSDTVPVPPAAASVGTADTLAEGAAVEIVPLVKRRTQPDTKPWGALVSVRRDGSDGETFPLHDEAADIGRTDGALLFEDRFLAPRHARVQKKGAGAVVIPLEQVNGVYFRLRPGDTSRIMDGDHLLLGKEVLRFEVVEPEERNLDTAIQHGVRLFGSPVRSPWARLRQIVQSGVARDIYHLVAAAAVVGREEGDLRFPDDEFMSRRHAQISNVDGRFEIVDLESSNGTYVRVRGDRALKRGDVIRMGDQLFRFEPAE